MTRKFPKNVMVTFRRTIDSQVSPAGHNFEARDASGAYLAGGWSAGSKRDARDAAWLALEQLGLVVDE